MVQQQLAKVQAIHPAETKPNPTPWQSDPGRPVMKRINSSPRASVLSNVGIITVDPLGPVVFGSPDGLAILRTPKSETKRAIHQDLDGKHGE